MRPCKPPSSKPKRGEQPDTGVVSAALPVAETCLQKLDDFAARTGWLAGDALSLADLHAVPMIGFFMRSPLAGPMLARHPTLAAWWDRMAARPSYAATAPAE